MPHRFAHPNSTISWNIRWNWGCDPPFCTPTFNNFLKHSLKLGLRPNVVNTQIQQFPETFVEIGLTTHRDPPFCTPKFNNFLPHSLKLGLRPASLHIQIQQFPKTFVALGVTTHSFAHPNATISWNIHWTWGYDPPFCTPKCYNFLKRSLKLGLRPTVLHTQMQQCSETFVEIGVTTSGVVTPISTNVSGNCCIWVCKTVGRNPNFNERFRKL